jgi:hypothetical protein
MVGQRIEIPFVLMMERCQEVDPLITDEFLPNGRFRRLRKVPILPSYWDAASDPCSIAGEMWWRTLFI